MEMPNSRERSSRNTGTFSLIAHRLKFTQVVLFFLYIFFLLLSIVPMRIHKVINRKKSHPEPT